MLTAPLERIDLGHSQIAYRRIGKGPDLLFVHGWPLNMQTWRDVAPLLSRDYTCHLVDLPGAGETEWTDAAPISIPGHAETVARIADALGLERYGMVAHDSGAAFARMVAAEHGDRVRALVLGNTEISGYTPLLLKLVVGIGQLPGGTSLLSPMFRWSWLRRSRLSLGGCFADPSFVDGVFHDVAVAPVLRSRRAFEGQMGLVRSFEWSALAELPRVHARIRAKTRFIWGAEDHAWFPAAEARRMVGELPAGADFVEIPRGRIFAHEEMPETFAAHARDFLREALPPLRSAERAA